MLRVLFFTFFLSYAIPGLSQTVISQFNWDGGPVTVAQVGPNATSVSGSAVSSVNGVGGTNGLNAGLPKADIDLVIPGSPTFDVDGIDISFEHQREENSGTFWRRGSSLVINGTSNLSVSYRVENGSGGYSTVNSGNVYSIPNDDTYRKYRFVYLPTTGFGYLTVNDVIVWTNDGPDNRNLYWTGAGDVIVGDGLDGTGFNNAFLDNLIVASVVNSALPIELLEFDAFANDVQNVEIEWATATEIKNDFFTLEKSRNGLDWEELTRVVGEGNSNSVINYQYEDESPYNGISYYRLKQTDFDGRTETFSPKAVTINSSSKTKVFPNPFETFCSVESDIENVAVYSYDGRDVSKQVQFRYSNGLLKMSFELLPSGVYLFSDGESTQRIIKR